MRQLGAPCTIALSLILSPMHWILERTAHRGLAGASLGEESFSDLDYADGVALLADEMLKVLILSLSQINANFQRLGLYRSFEVHLTNGAFVQHIQKCDR